MRLRRSVVELLLLRRSGVADAVAPTLSSAQNGTETADGSTNFGVSTNEGNGTLYWAILTNGGSATDAQIKAGAGGNIVAGKAGNQAVTTTGAQTVASVTGLAGLTDYEIVFLQRDAAGNDSAQAEVGLTTLATITAPAASWSAGSSELTITATTNFDLSSGRFGARISVGEGDVSYVWFDGAGAASSQSLVLSLAALEAEFGALPAAAVMNVDPGYSLTDPAVDKVYASESSLYPTPVVYTASVDDATPTEGVLVTGTFDMIVGPIGQALTYRWTASTTGIVDTTIDYTPTAGVVGETLVFRTTSTLGALSGFDDADATSAVASSGPITVSSTQTAVENSAVGTSVTATLASNPTPGNVLLLFGGVNAAANFSSISDTVGDSVSWTQMGTVTTAAGIEMYCWAKVVGGTVTGNTVTMNASGSTRLHIALSEYTPSSAIATVAIDGTQSSDAQTTTQADPGTNATSDANCVLEVGYKSGGTFGVGTDFTLLMSQGSGFQMSAQVKLNVGAGTQSAAWAVGASALWTACGLGIKVAA